MRSSSSASGYRPATESASDSSAKRRSRGRDGHNLGSDSIRDTAQNIIQQSQETRRRRRLQTHESSMQYYPTAAQFPRPWGISAVQAGTFPAPRSNRAPDGSYKVLCLVDTGIDVSHPSLQGPGVQLSGFSANVTEFADNYGSTSINCTIDCGDWYQDSVYHGECSDLHLHLHSLS